MSAVAVGTRVLFAGGKSATPPNAPSDVVDVYDTVTNHWSVTHLPHPDAPAVGSVSTSPESDPGVVANLAMFFGPLTGAQSLDLYDPASGKWLSRSAPRSRTYPAVEVNGARVLLVSQRLSPSDNVDIYDTATDTWSAVTLAAPRVNPTVATVGSRTLIAGGLQGTSPDSPTSDVVDILDWSIDPP